MPGVMGAVVPIPIKTLWSHVDPDVSKWMLSEMPATPILVLCSPRRQPAVHKSKVGGTPSIPIEVFTPMQTESSPISLEVIPWAPCACLTPSDPAMSTDPMEMARFSALMPAPKPIDMMSAW